MPLLRGNPLAIQSPVMELGVSGNRGALRVGLSGMPGDWLPPSVADFLDHQRLISNRQAAAEIRAGLECGARRGDR